MRSNQSDRSQLEETKKRFDTVSLATLTGVLIMLGVAGLNMWNINRLAERIAHLEANALAARAVPTAPRGPDPSRIYEIATAGAAAKGPDDAPITIIEFADFECPFCGRVTSTLRRIEDVYKGRVKFVWKHLPLSIHVNAVPAALAAEAARKQGKFWEYHDKLFENQQQLTMSDLKRYSQELQLDEALFENHMSEPELRERVDADREEADQLEVNVTPSFFINGRYLRGAQPFEAFAKVIDEELTKRNLPVPSKSAAE